MKFLIKNIIKDPNFIKEKEANSRQKLKQVYLRSGLIYLTKTKIILEKNSLQGDKSFGVITPISRSLNIDNINDFRLAELIIKKKYKINDQ